MSAAPQEGQDVKGVRPLVRDYTLIALAALAVLFLVLFVEGPGVWAVVPVVIGVIGVLARWSAGPPLFLLALTFLYGIGNLLVGLPMSYRPQPSPLIDAVLAMAALAYVAAHMRLLTLTTHGVPPDPRRRRKPLVGRVAGRWLLPGDPSRRTAARGAAGELLLFLVAVPAFTIVAALLWVPLGLEESPYRRLLPDRVWHFFLVLWAMLVVLYLARSLLGYLGLARANREQALLYLQDQLWTATRGEQRRITRWLGWSRLKKQRKKEG